MENMRNHLQGESDRICNNFRPVQPVNDRKVFAFAPTAKPLPTAPPAPDGELGRIAPSAKSMPLARLVGSPSNEQSQVADTRNELQTDQANGPKPEDANKVNFQQLAAPNSAFTKSSAGKDSKLIPDGNVKQELNKDVEKLMGFAGKAGKLSENKDARVNKPTVAPGMRREHV